MTFRALALRQSEPIRSDEGLKLETSAFRISVRWPIYIINSVDKTKFLYNMSNSLEHWHKTEHQCTYVSMNGRQALTICCNWHEEKERSLLGPTMLNVFESKMVNF